MATTITFDCINCGELFSNPNRRRVSGEAALR